MDGIRQRHDVALGQIAAAISKHAAANGTELHVDATVPEFDGPALRPDLVLRNVQTKKCVIADLAITFEDQTTEDIVSSSLQHSRSLKMAKYRPIAAALQRQGWRVETAALM